ncbi:ParB/RepB/Spo0J family partition protein [Ochrobactrum sp. A-1]|uniref:ParB/RepB/Spo0J family partition protein n=1 Tax=Ochrobactrum sp. A-1 TaxID=2920940 RepID=UPI001F0B35CE|nr:ParB/RepB/Spo0J family partition protein [Ochrobactrum sp. A-1]
MNISDIKIGDRHRNDLGDLSALARSIGAQGLLQPIGVTSENVLVFGERRLTACRDILGWTEIEARIVDVTSIVEGEHDENELRKDFTPSERVAIARAVEEALGDRRGVNQYTKEGPQNIAEAQGKETRQIAAEKAGFGNPETYRQAKSVVETGVPELVDKMDAGEVSVSGAALIAKQDKEIQKKIVAEDNLKKAVSELRQAEKQLKEVKAMPAPEPLTDEEKQRASEIFGTQEDRAISAIIDEIIERTDGLPTPSEAARRIPQAIRYAVNPASIRKSAEWLITFAEIWEQESIAHEQEAAE